MKKYALLLMMCICLPAITVNGNRDVSFDKPQTITNKITAERAKAIALKRMPGTVEEEYTLENDKGEIDTYVFIIKNKKGKTFEIQIESAKGDVVSVEEFSDDGDEDDSDDTTEDPPPAFR